MSANGVRHFLDLIDVPPQALRGMIDASRAIKATGSSATAARRKRPLAGKTLAMVSTSLRRARACLRRRHAQLGGEILIT